MSRHACNRSTRPCFCPPHPQFHNNTSQLEPNRQIRTNNAQVPLSRPTGSVVGMNDGQIFPREHFDGAPSFAQLVNAAADRAPLRNDVRVVVVLAEFPDKQFSADHDPAHFDKLFFQPGGVGFGSVSEYYQDVSHGNISLVGEVAGPFNMPNPLTYYSHGAAGTGASPNLQDLADDVVNAAVSQLGDLGPYDNDHNGYVDAFIIVHAGSGAEQSGNQDDIWSVKWVLHNERQIGGAKVFGFLTIPEDAQIGVCAHELGHLLFGWPDLYDTDYSSAGIGNWCVMAGGTWGGDPAGSRPVHPSAWCKAQQQWVSVVNETANGPVSVQDVKTANCVHRVWTNGDQASTEYFLLENRQQTGSDQFLPGGGLLIWHIDDAAPGNEDEKHRKVDLMQADGLGQLYIKAGSSDPGDPFPGTANNDTFTAETNPSSKGYNGQDTKVAVTGISVAGDVINTNIQIQ